VRIHAPWALLLEELLMSKTTDTKAWAAWSKEASPADLCYFREVGNVPRCSHCSERMHFQRAPLDKGVWCCTHCEGGDVIYTSE